MTTPEAETFFAASRSWDSDMRRRSQRSARIAWIVAGIACLGAMTALGAVAFLVPLKTVQPYVIRVNEVSGTVDIVRALDHGSMEANEAVAKYFLWQYIQSREDWLPAMAEQNYRRVILMSSGDLQKQWADYMSPGNPQGPQATLGPGATARVTLKTISFLAENVASVRFARVTHRGTHQVDERSDWIATITFAFHPDAEMHDDDRMTNPFGFLVEDIRTDPEPAGPGGGTNQ